MFFQGNAALRFFLCDTLITRLFFFIYEAEGTDPAFQSDGKRRDMHQKIVYQSVFENSFLQLHAPQTVTHILQKAISKHAPGEWKEKILHFTHKTIKIIVEIVKIRNIYNSTRQCYNEISFERGGDLL